ncbi:hypothetical protein CI41S_19710 [Bradyrhizobium ivorense]|nr:hypothetical protein CI41S_19710 [Bradyrhizobium ivorense]
MDGRVRCLKAATIDQWRRQRSLAKPGYRAVNDVTSAPGPTAMHSACVLAPPPTITTIRACWTPGTRQPTAPPACMTLRRYLPLRSQARQRPRSSAQVAEARSEHHSRFRRRLRCIQTLSAPWTGSGAAPMKRIWFSRSYSHSDGCGSYDYLARCVRNWRSGLFGLPPARPSRVLETIEGSSGGFLMMPAPIHSTRSPLTFASRDPRHRGASQPFSFFCGQTKIPGIRLRQGCAGALESRPAEALAETGHGRPRRSLRGYCLVTNTNHTSAPLSLTRRR